MLNQTVQSDQDRTYYSNTLIRYLTKRQQYKDALKVYKDMRTYNIPPDMFTYTAMMNLYCRTGQTEKGLDILDLITLHGLTPNVFSFTAAINLLVKADREQEALEMLDQMIESGVKPNVYTYTTLLKMYCQNSQYKRVYELWAEMLGHGIRPTHISCQVMVDCKMAEGRLDDAMRIYRDMVQPHLEMLTVQQYIEHRQNVSSWKLAESSDLPTKPRSIKVDLHYLSHGTALMALLTLLDEQDLHYFDQPIGKLDILVICGKGHHSKTGPLHQMRSYLTDMLNKYRPELHVRTSYYNSGMLIISRQPRVPHPSVKRYVQSKMTRLSTAVSGESTQVGVSSLRGCNWLTQISEQWAPPPVPTRVMKPRRRC